MSFSKTREEPEPMSIAGRNRNTYHIICFLKVISPGSPELFGICFKDLHGKRHLKMLTMTYAPHRHVDE